MKTLIFTDPHYCTKEGFTGSDRKPRLSLEKMERLVEKAKRDGVGLIVCLGDFIHQNVFPEAEIHHRVKNYDSLLALLERHNVTDVFRGH